MSLLAFIYTTKALIFHTGLKGFIIQIAAKAASHINERQQLERWAATQPSSAIAAGDFNAPPGSVGLA